MSPIASAPTRDTGQGSERPAEGRSAAVIGFCTLLLIGTDLFVVAPLLSSLGRTYGTSSDVTGLVVTAFSVAYMVVAPLMGRIADKYGRRTVLIAGLAVFGLANCCSAAAPNMALLLVARVVAGSAAAAVTPSVYALVGMIAPPARRGAWLAVVGSGLLIALATGAPLGAVMASAVGWRGVFVVLGVVAACFGVLSRIVWPPAQGSGSRHAYVSVSILAKLRVSGSAALWGMAVYGVYTYLATEIRRVDGLSSGGVAAVTAVFGVSAVFGSVAGGRLADHVGAKRVAILSLVGLSASEMCLIGLYRGGLLGAFGGAVLMAGLGYAWFPAQQSRLMGSAPTSQQASVLAWNNSCLYLGIAAGSGLGGVVISTVGFDWLVGLCACVAVGGAALGLQNYMNPLRTQKSEEVGARAR